MNALPPATARPALEALVRQLRESLPPDRVAINGASRVAYSYDATYRRHLPEVVVFPQTTEEVATVARVCYRHEVPFFPRGGGTGLSGGSVPLGGVAVVMTHMDRILWVDPANLQMRVEAGVTTTAAQQAAAAHGLMYPPDPGSATISTIGGNIATDAAGSRSFHYGTTRRYVLGLQAVLPDGRVLETGSRTAKNATGIDLTHWLVGSEGILGIITQATLRLLPPPEASASIRATFARTDRCGQAIVALARSPARPAAVEFFDRTSLQVVEDYLHAGLPVEAAGFLLCLVEGRREAVGRQAAEVAALCREHGAYDVEVAEAGADQARLWEARHAVSPAVARLKPTKIAEDVTVPIGVIPEFIDAVHAIGERFGVTVVLFGHAGDGNFHPNFVCDERDADEMARVEQAVAALFEEALRQGGTLSGEHGTGLLKAPFLPKAVGQVNLELQRAIKRLVDPKGLLNPGKVFPDDGGEGQ